MLVVMVMCAKTIIFDHHENRLFDEKSLQQKINVLLPNSTNKEVRIFTSSEMIVEQAARMRTLFQAKGGGDDHIAKLFRDKTTTKTVLTTKQICCPIFLSLENDQLEANPEQYFLKMQSFHRCSQLNGIPEAFNLSSIQIFEKRHIFRT